MFPVELPHTIHQFSSDVDLADDMGCIISPLRLLALFFYYYYFGWFKEGMGGRRGSYFRYKWLILENKTESKILVHTHALVDAPFCGVRMTPVTQAEVASLHFPFSQILGSWPVHGKLPQLTGEESWSDSGHRHKGCFSTYARLETTCMSQHRQRLFLLFFFFLKKNLRRYDLQSFGDGVCVCLVLIIADVNERKNNLRCICTME